MTLLSCYTGVHMEVHKKFTMLMISVFLFIFLSAAASDNPNTRSVLPTDPRITSLARTVYQDIFDHSPNQDRKNSAITYLYIHENSNSMQGNVAISPSYTNLDVKNILLTKPPQKVTRIKPPVTSLEPPIFPPTMDGNLIIGTVARAKEILPKLNKIDQSSCPVLVIFGRGIFGNKQQDVDGWPPDFIMAKNAVNTKCPATRFFYYINAKPKAEKVLERLEKNNVNVIYSSDFPRTEL